MIRLTLTPDQRAALQSLRHDASLSPLERDRVEMVLLNVDGWSALRIAAHLSYNVITVRAVLTKYRANGVSALRRKSPGPAADLVRRETVETALRECLRESRTWTTRQLAAALQDRGIELAPRTVRTYLSRMDARYRRISRSLDHKQDPAKVAQAEEELAAFKNEPMQAN